MQLPETYRVSKGTVLNGFWRKDTFRKWEEIAITQQPSDTSQDNNDGQGLSPPPWDLKKVHIAEAAVGTRKG